MNERFRYPTPDEMLAIERAARLARARAVDALFSAAARGLGKLISSIAVALAEKARRPRSAARYGV
jgi:hypothetical protein